MSEEEVDAYLKGFDVELTPPEDFSFPFPPYDIQRQFMTALYSTLENGRLGIFESPTGTGKSLSLICGALSWLRDEEERRVARLEAAAKAAQGERAKFTDESSDWLTAQVQRLKWDNLERAVRQKIARIERERQRIGEIRTRAKQVNVQKRKKVPVNVTEVEEDSDILLADEVSDEEVDEDVVDEQPPVKIIFCSRTHSQLSQFVGEIRRTKFADSVRVVPLGSRQSCCINESVRRLGSLSLMNDKCLEMAKSTKDKSADQRAAKRAKTSCRCPHLSGVDALRDVVTAEVLDLEGIVERGASLSGCPYYATRAAASDAQVVLAPYNTLFHKSTREASRIDLRNAVVLVDEAHNLLETVSHIHSAEVTGAQLTSALGQLSHYKDKFEKRFTSMNLLRLSQLIFVLKCFVKFLDGPPDEKVLSTVDFILSSGVDNYNLFTLIAFCTKNKIAHKIRGFSDKYSSEVKVRAEKGAGMRSFLRQVVGQVEQASAQDECPPAVVGQPLVPTLALLQSLTLGYEEGRVVLRRSGLVGTSRLKYLLLDPTAVLREVVATSRSVVLAGGTMKPFNEFRDRLFLACGAPSSRIVEFTCGHVIPQTNILPIVVSQGPTSQTMDFTFKTRDSTELLSEVGRVLVNISSVVPGGIVCFFPSYDYESRVHAHLTANGTLKRLSGRKKLFREPKTSSAVEGVLREYAEAAQSTGALMFSVVGGKLSEGLNFADDLGRCVVVVGLPYPNINSPELKEKMTHLDERLGAGAGRDFYENCCMKAVNQCIGRAVRHRADYAAVLLLDRRYAAANHIRLLPDWIAASLVLRDQFGPVLGLLAQFFKRHKAQM